MSTEELIEELISWAEVEGAGTRANILREAAERLDFLFMIENSSLLGGEGNGKSREMACFEVDERY